MTNFKRQIFVYYLFSFLNRFMLYYPVFVLFLNKIDFSQAQIMTLLAFYNVAIFFSEIPTGIIADRYSRKISVLIGCFLQGFAMFTMLLTKNFFCFVIIEIVFGIGITFQSGAITALIYDYLDSIKKREEFPKIEGKKWGLTFFSQGIAAVLGGFLAEYNIESTIFFTALLYCISALVLLLFKEAPLPSSSISKYTIHLKESFSFILSNQKVAPFFLIIIINEALLATTLWLYQPYFQSINIPITLFGVLYFAQFALRACGGIWGGKRKLHLRQTIYWYVTISVSCTLFMGFFHSPIGIIFPLIIFYSCGRIQPWLQKYWEDELPSEKRATIDSFLSLSSSLVFFVVSIPLGILADTKGIYSALIIPSFTFGILLYLIYIYMVHKKVL